MSPFFTIVISLVLAVPAVLAVVVTVPGTLHIARQTTDPGFNIGEIPPACTSACTVFTQTLTGDCADISCLCTNTIVNGFKSCLDCGVKANVPDLNQTFVDSSINELVEDCKEAGVDLSNPVSGSTSDAPTTSGGNTGTSSTTGTGTAGTGTTGGTTQNAPGGATGGKSNAIANYSRSIVGSVAAIAMAGYLAL